MELSADQERASAQILAALAAGDRVSVLVGPAGSGKTTLLRALLARLEEGAPRDVALLCPTGKAASRLASVTGRPARTIHRALYGRVEEVGAELVFGDACAPCPPGGLVICDEASMVDAALHDDLLAHLPPRAQLLYVGDREQLPPVQGSWGPDFEQPTAALETVHRQAELSPILSLATAIRRREPWKAWQPGVCEQRQGDPAGWLVERLAAGQDATLITTTNQRRAALNAAVREKLGRTQPLAPGERLVCLINNTDAGLMNGEVREVVAAKPSPALSYLHRGTVWDVTLDGGESVLVNVDLLGAPAPAFHAWRGRRSGPLNTAIHVDYGYCLTVHKAQGSQWDRVGFALCPAFRRMADRRRLAYTAVTRAIRELVLFEDA